MGTDQLGRTFEDRTHCFRVRDRSDAGIADDHDGDMVLVATNGQTITTSRRSLRAW